MQSDTEIQLLAQSVQINNNNNNYSGRELAAVRADAERSLQATKLAFQLDSHFRFHLGHTFFFRGGGGAFFSIRAGWRHDGTLAQTPEEKFKKSQYVLSTLLIGPNMGCNW